MYEYEKISEYEFWNKINNQDGEFSHKEIDFEIDFEKIKEIDFELKFSKTIFRKKAKFRKTEFLKPVSFIRVIFEDEVDFFDSKFNDVFSASKTIFKHSTVFNLVKFNSDADFNKTVFMSPVYFKKAHFNRNTFFHKTNFAMKADFSYANFPSQYLMSFLSINEKMVFKGKKWDPLFIFRNILFSPGTIFSDVNLSRAIFQDSIIEDIVFKECIFPKIDGRNAFYTELAKTKKLVINSDFEKIVEGKINTLIFDVDDPMKKMCLSDKIIIKDRESGKKETFFVVTKFYFDSVEDAINKFDSLNHSRSFVGIQDILWKNFTQDEYSGKVIALRIKKFIAEKHWEVLEDLYRQMKKSLEDSHDWQMAGDFYKGEMNAKIHLLKEKSEQFWYRCTLWIYKLISYFGESISRILLIIFFSLNIGNIVLLFFKPELGRVDILSKNISLFLPIFGSNTITVDSLDLRPFQEVILYVEIAWFYTLWAILAIAIRRRYRR